MRPALTPSPPSIREFKRLGEAPALNRILRNISRRQEIQRHSDLSKACSPTASGIQKQKEASSLREESGSRKGSGRRPYVFPYVSSNKSLSGFYENYGRFLISSGLVSESCQARRYEPLIQRLGNGL
ncbi:hypothetical protein YC2023_080195 [Brassica napus]